MIPRPRSVRSILRRFGASIPFALVLLAAPRTSLAQVPRATIARTMLGDATVMVNARGDSLIEVAAADGRRSIAMTLALSEARAWVDSSTRILRYRARNRATPVSYRNLVEEPGVAGGGVTLTRRVTKGASEYSLFFADTAFGGFAVPVTREEATLFVSAVRKAVAASAKLSPQPPAPEPRRKKKPAAKRPAS